MVTNRLYDIMKSFPDLAQELEIQTVLTESGSILRLAGSKDITKDPNIITKFVDGKPIGAMLVNDEIRKPLEMVTTITNRSFIEIAFTAPARVFSLFTTGIYPPFIVPNTNIDQFTAYINSKE